MERRRFRVKPFGLPSRRTRSWYSPDPGGFAAAFHATGAAPRAGRSAANEGSRAPTRDHVIMAWSTASAASPAFGRLGFVPGIIDVVNAGFPAPSVSQTHPSTSAVHPRTPGLRSLLRGAPADVRVSRAHGPASDSGAADRPIAFGPRGSIRPRLREKVHRCTGVRTRGTVRPSHRPTGPSPSASATTCSSVRFTSRASSPIVVSPSITGGGVVSAPTSA